MKESILKKYTEGISLEEGYKRIREGFAFIDGSVFGMYKVAGSGAADAVSVRGGCRMWTEIPYLLF